MVNITGVFIYVLLTWPLQVNKGDLLDPYFSESEQLCQYFAIRLKEKFTLIIFSLFHLNWPRIAFYNPIYKNDFFLSKLFLLHHLYKIYMAFYLLTWTYFNEVIVGRNILIDSQVKRNLFIRSEEKIGNKTQKDRKNMEKPMKVT